MLCLTELPALTIRNYPAPVKYVSFEVVPATHETGRNELQE